MRKPKHLKHIFGILLGFVLIIFGTIFALWQLDIIVSGCVWHENPDGSGWAWHDGAYAKAYFQCFLWKTTIGQAYDTLFLYFRGPLFFITISYTNFLLVYGIGMMNRNVRNVTIYFNFFY